MEIEAVDFFKDKPMVKKLVAERAAGASFRSLEKLFNLKSAHGMTAWRVFQWASGKKIRASKTTITRALSLDLETDKKLTQAMDAYACGRSQALRRIMAEWEPPK